MIFTFKNRLTMAHFNSLLKNSGNKKAPIALASGALVFVDFVSLHVSLHKLPQFMSCSSNSSATDTLIL
jgi:hypothetical protein